MKSVRILPKLNQQTFHNYCVTMDMGGCKLYVYIPSKSVIVLFKVNVKYMICSYLIESDFLKRCEMCFERSER